MMVRSIVWFTSLTIMASTGSEASIAFSCPRRSLRWLIAIVLWSMSRSRQTSPTIGNLPPKPRLVSPIGPTEIPYIGIAHISTSSAGMPRMDLYIPRLGEASSIALPSAL